LFDFGDPMDVIGVLQNFHLFIFHARVGLNEEGLLAVVTPCDKHFSLENVCEEIKSPIDRPAHPSNSRLKLVYETSKVDLVFSLDQSIMTNSLDPQSKRILESYGHVEVDGYEGQMRLAALWKSWIHVVRELHSRRSQ
jgi:hypothetical protein